MELKAFADAVNGGQSDACGKLTAVIDLGGSADNQWTPIGLDFEHPFTGTFDGQGHTVSGLYFDAPTTKYAGLFGCMKEGGTIRNLGVVAGHVRGIMATSAPHFFDRLKSSSGAVLLFPAENPAGGSEGSWYCQWSGSFSR